MVLNCFNNVTEFHGLEDLLCEDSVEVVEGYEEMVQVALTFLEGSGVAEGALIVRNGPFGSTHNAQVVVQFWVDTSEEGVLGCEALACN